MRPSVFLVSLTVALMLGCANPESPGETLFCVGAKCDDGSDGPTPLTAVSLESMGRCRGIVDRSSSDFFARHEIRCSFDPPAGIVLERVYTEIRTARPDIRGGSLDLTGSDLPIGRVTNDDFPIQVRVTLAFKSATTDNPTFQRTHYWGMEAELADADALAAWTLANPHAFGPPLEAWPVVFWPAPELVDAWDAGDARYLAFALNHRFEVTGSGELAVAGPEPIGTVENRVQIIERARQRADLRELAQQTRALLMPTGAVEPVDVRVTTRDVSNVESRLSGPGYYVVGLDGQATLTPVTDLPELAVPVPEGDCNDACTEAETCVDALCVPIPCGGTCAAGQRCVDEACVTPPACGGLCLENEECVDEACVPVDPCEGACSESEACVAATCVTRADQTQRTGFSSTRCEAPTASCDAGEDGDCAEGHGCVEGQCRRLACQQQSTGFSSTSCEAADQPCENAGHCAEDHACVAGLCRRLSCQNQDTGFSTTTCEPADQPCATGGDCASGHTCVEGLCRRTACQNQDTGFSSTSCDPADQPCAVNEDCTDAHACVQGLCRRLACQNQDTGFSSTSCEPADQPCEVDAHCAEAHACGETRLCERVACQPSP